MNTGADIAALRLRNQLLAGSTMKKAEDVVEWLGAVQAQDYAGAKWAVGQRVKGLTDAAVEEAFNRGAILRTHVMRPTWHFVAPADIRWLLALTAPRVYAVSAYYRRKYELDEKTLVRSRVAFESALAGGKHLTRTELGSALQRAGIPASGPRLALLTIHVELAAVICSGPRRGKQFTYALLDERAPHAKTLHRDEALAELTRRYFTSHGPATARDFSWWSGLTVADARNGIEMIRSSIEELVIKGRTCYFCGSASSGRTAARSTARSAARSTARSAARSAAPAVHLLPNYDEYLIAYKDRDLIARLGKGADRFPYHLVIDGRLAGSWRPMLKGKSIVVEIGPYSPLSRAHLRAVSASTDLFGRFIEMSVSVVLR